MQNTDSIEKLFREKFQHFEADVNPHIWTNVQSGINSGAGSAAGAAAKIAIGKTIAGAVVVTVIAGSTWYFSKWDNKKEISPSDSKPKSDIVTNLPIDQQSIISQNQSSNVIANTQSKNIVSVPPSIRNSSGNSQQTQVASGANDNPIATTISSSDNTGSNLQPVTKYGNAPKGDGGMVRGNKIQNPKAYSSIPPNNGVSSVENADNSSNAGNSSGTESEDASKPNEIKPVSEFFNIPNIFTPNGDGINDFFSFEMKNIVSINVEIFNQKTGECTAKWNTLDGNWNGKLLNGNDALDGVYIYSIHSKGTDGIERSKSGLLTLKR